MTTTTHFPYLGTVRYGTRAIHLLEPLANVLDRLHDGEYLALVHIARRRAQIIRAHGELDDGAVSDGIIDQLFEVLNEYAPDGYYFGANELDDSDFGFWPVH